MLICDSGRPSGLRPGAVCGAALLAGTLAVARGALGLEHHQIKHLAGLLDRDHFDVDVLPVRPVADVQSGFPRGTAGFLRGLQRRAQAMQQPFARQLQHMEARLAGRGLEIVAGLSVELHDVKILIDEHAGRRVPIEHDAMRFADDAARAAGHSDSGLGARHRAEQRGRSSSRSSSRAKKH